MTTQELATQTEFIPLAQLVDELKQARENLTNFNAQIRLIQESIAEPLREVKSKQVIADSRCAELETQIRERGVEFYDFTGDKHPIPGVEIKLFDEATIEDADAVRAFCFKGLPAALVVDEKKVKKYALDFDAVPGVKVTRDVPRAQIATKL